MFIGLILHGLSNVLGNDLRIVSLKFLSAGDLSLLALEGNRDGIGDELGNSLLVSTCKGLLEFREKAFC